MTVVRWTVAQHATLRCYRSQYRWLRLLDSVPICRKRSRGCACRPASRDVPRPGTLRRDGQRFLRRLAPLRCSVLANSRCPEECSERTSCQRWSGPRTRRCASSVALFSRSASSKRFWSTYRLARSSRRTERVWVLIAQNTAAAARSPRGTAARPLCTCLETNRHSPDR